MKETIQIRKNFISLSEAKVLINDLSQFLKYTKKGNADRIGFSKSAFSLEKFKQKGFTEKDTVKELTGDIKTDNALKLFTKIYFKMKKEMEKFFEIDMMPIDCNLSRIFSKGHNWPPHIDDELGNHKGMEYTGILYLNDFNKDFTGGEIYFPLDDLTIEPKTGTFIFFKSDWRAPHGVKTVLSGERNAMVIFIGDLKQIKERSNE